MIRRSLFAFVALIVASPAFATVIYDWEYPYAWLTEGDVVEETHSISLGADQHVYDADLFLYFADDDLDYVLKCRLFSGCYWRVGELDKALIEGPGFSEYEEVDGSHLFGYDRVPVSVGTAGLEALNEDGELTFTVTAIKTDGFHNDFWWKKSLLKAYVETKAVSEPGTLALLGAGLLGLGWMSRRRRSV